MKLISVIICTYNRAALLERALHGLLAQEAAPPFEVIVVDNNSTDRTQQVLEAWNANSRLALRVIDERRQGLSHARNAGLRAARGAVIAFVDDDTVADRAWLRELANAFARHPDVDCIGGPCEPEWEVAPPAWLTDELASLLAPGRFGPLAKILVGKEYPPGGNMAFRRQVVARIGGFSPALGHVGPSLMGGEELEWVDRLRACGGKAMYIPAVRLRHLVSAARVTRPYCLGRRRWEGRTTALCERFRGGRRLLVRNAMLRALLAIPRDVVVWVVLTLLGDRDRRFTYLCRLAKTLAYLGQAGVLLLAHGDTLEGAAAVQPTPRRLVG